MKKILLAVALLCVGSATFAQDKAAPAPATAGATYGQKISAAGAIPVSQLAQKLGNAGAMNLKVSGKIVEVCKKKGCFMTMELPTGEHMMVRFKDYGFFMPFDIPGKTVVLDGVAKQETLSVEDQKHYAEDAKKTTQEIAKITAPKQQITFEATGVLVL